jgi:hypothetical protein
MDADHGLSTDTTLLNRDILVLIVRRLRTQKPGLDGLALAFKIVSRAKDLVGPSCMARLGPAYSGPAWPGSRPEAGPGTALEMI